MTRSRESGFTLVEALIAIVLLAVGLMAVTNLFVIAAASNQVGNSTTITTAAATDVMEKLKAIRFDLLQPGGNVQGITVERAGVTYTPAVNEECNVVPGVFQCVYQPPGLGQEGAVPLGSTVVARWEIQAIPVAGPPVYLIIARAEVIGPFGGRLSRSEFRVFRSPFCQRVTDPGCS
jgi:prepilin-type N-terminal cleavage/methylation domain-containing protein